MLAYYQSFGNSSHPLVLVQMEEMIKTCHDRGSVDKQRKGWLAFFRTKGNWRRFRMIVFLAFSNPFSGINLIASCEFRASAACLYPNDFLADLREILESVGSKYIYLVRIVLPLISVTVEDRKLQLTIVRLRL
jgi:hypothetical protein